MRGLDTYIHRFTILIFFALFVGKDYRERERGRKVRYFMYLLSLELMVIFSIQNQLREDGFSLFNSFF